MKKNSERVENNGYNARASYIQIRNYMAEKISNKKFKDEQDARNREYATIRWEEQGKKSQLTELGKICYFIETFDNIPLSEQKIEAVGPFEDPRESKSFQQGYKTAEAFVKNGFTKENYHSFVENYEKKYGCKKSKNI